MLEKNIHYSKIFKTTLIAGGVVIVVLVIFLTGVAVGYHKASFSYRVGEHYDALFDKDDHNPMTPAFDADAIPGGHEAAGKVVSVELPVFVVVGPDNIEKKVEIEDNTVINKLRGTASSSDISVGDSVVIIGTPGTDSDIAAQLIRIFPAAPPTPVGQ